MIMGTGGKGPNKEYASLFMPYSIDMVLGTGPEMVNNPMDEYQSVAP